MRPERGVGRGRARWLAARGTGGGMIATRCAQSADGLTPPAAPRGNRKPKPRANATTKGAHRTRTHAQSLTMVCARARLGRSIKETITICSQP